MTVFAAVVMILAAFGFVLYPFFRNSLDTEPAGPGDGTPGGADDPLQQKKDSLFSTIKELESDFDLGNLSQQDYDQLRQTYEMKALQTLRDIDLINEERQEAVSDEIEAVVSKLRRGGPAGAPPAAGKVCASCGTQMRAADRFCHKCGSPAAPACPTCGTAVVPGDIFCSGCGAKLDSGSG